MAKNWNIQDYKLRGLFRLVLDEVHNLKLELLRQMSNMQDSVNEMKAEVTRNTTVTGAVKALIDGFIAAATEAADDPEEIRALVAELKANTDALAAAVPANTPAPVDPEPPVQEPSE